MVSTLVFTYAGTPAFFNIVAEMRDPHLYPRALAVCQITVTSIYIIVATIVCYFCGSYVASPALGSAGVLIKKVSYGIALPGLSVSGILLLHVSKPISSNKRVRFNTPAASCQALLCPNPTRV